jgi:exosortase A-associated hydrolase 2
MARIPFFMPNERSASGCFCIYHPPKLNKNEKMLGMVLYVHPFAEEMNKSRHMAARQATDLASSGFAVLQIDLSGCGDSAGDFLDATWNAWIQDIRNACCWMELNIGPDLNKWDKPPLWLWGLRAGCLLLAEAAQHMDKACSFIFWQPLLAGDKELTQLIRLQRVSNMLNTSSEDLNSKLETHGSNNKTIDILGYSVIPELAQGFAQAKLKPPSSNGSVQHVVWIEMTASEPTELTLASMQTLKHWKDMGANTVSHLLKGPAFWCSNELINVPELISFTTRTVTSLSYRKFELMN